jgi:hypothetical protein
MPRLNDDALGIQVAENRGLRDLAADAGSGPADYKIVRLGPMLRFEVKPWQ